MQKRDRKKSEDLLVAARTMSRVHINYNDVVGDSLIIISVILLIQTKQTVIT